MTTRTLRFCLATLSLGLCCLASGLKSETDQYGTHILYQSHPPRSFGEAYKVIKSQHRFDLHPKKPIPHEEYPLDNDIVPDLQVGCGDGLFVETTTPSPVIPKHKKIYPKKERRKREINNKKTGYFAYSVRAPASYSYTFSTPHKYKPQKPYYIPAKSNVRTYYQPHPIFINPGFPFDNPPIFNKSPDRPRPSVETTTAKVNIFDRFGEPIWDRIPIDPPASTTRRPNVLTTSTFPPLVHNPDPNMPTGRPTAKTTTTTAVPPPPAMGNRPSPPALNQCVWAIINCCSAGSKDISNTCFERLGCPGPFWDRSPCESEFAREALDYAMQYYQDK